MFIVIPALLSIILLVVLYRKKTSRQEDHVYDYVEPSSPPQLPPSRLTTHDNPAYERFELKDCEAYSSGLNTVETIELSSPPSPRLATRHDNPAYELKDCEAYTSGLKTVETVEPSSPPQLPPPQLTTHDNPAYEKFELKDCDAYSSGLKTVEADEQL